MRVLAIDPGERAGWATGEISSRIATIVKPKSYVGHQMSEGARLPDGLTADEVELTWSQPVLKVTDHGISFMKDMSLAAYRAIVVEKKYDAVVVESYLISGNPERLRSHIGSDVPTLQLFGQIRAYCWIANVRLVVQPPKAMTDADLSLKNPGGEEILAILARLPKAHDESHNGSALRHLWSFFFKEFV